MSLKNFPPIMAPCLVCGMNTGDPDQVHVTCRKVKMATRDSIREQIVDLCRNNPEGLHRLVILKRIPAAYMSDIDALFDDGRLAKMGGAPTLFVVPPAVNDKRRVK